MAAITPTIAREPLRQGRHILRYSGTGTANQADSLSTATAATVTPHGTGGARRLMYAACHYSAGPTQAGVTFVIDSGVGSGFDTTLSTGTANAQNTVYSPDEEIWLLSDDDLVINAPAGGGGVTASILIVLEGV